MGTKTVFAIPWLGMHSCDGPQGFCGAHREKETFASLGV